MVNQPYANSITGLILKRSFLTFIVVFFFGDIAIYLSLAVSPRLDPQYWIGLLVVLGAALAWFSPQTRWEVFRTPVFFWCVVFLALTLIFFFSVPTSYVEQLKERIRDVVLLTAFLAVFLMLPDELPFLRKVILIVAVLGAAINLISLVNSDFLSPPGIDSAYRPAGFYINPNESGIALTIGLVLSVGILSPRWREPYAILSLIGVLATFSREAILGWLIVVLSTCVVGLVSWKRLIVFMLALLTCAAVIMLALVLTHWGGLHISDFYHLQIERLSWFVGGSGAGGSNEMRIKALRLGWITFLAHPFIGNGIGYTYHWSLPVSTHCMYLLYMDDYGVVGFFLYPLLIWCMVRGARGETRKLAWTMGIFLLFWGLFDHNIVQNYYSLFAISLTAAMSRISATESAQRTQTIPAETAPG